MAAGRALTSEVAPVYLVLSNSCPALLVASIALLVAIVAVDAIAKLLVSPAGVLDWATLVSFVGCRDVVPAVPIAADELPASETLPENVGYATVVVPETIAGV